MSAGAVRLDQQGPVAWITISNPAKRNAISLAMWRQLDALLAAIGDETLCIVVRGEGDRAFVAGADISEFVDQRRLPADVAHYDASSDAAMNRLWTMPQPTVAMISGFCIGAGMAIALCCDIRFAAEGSEFAVPAARLGVGYGATGLQQLLNVVSVPVATDIMISGRRYPAQEACRLGLVNAVIAPDDLEDHVRSYAADVSRNAPLTVRASKRTIKELARTNPAADLGLCRALAAECFASTDYVEGATAFLEKREPRFVGR